MTAHGECGFVVGRSRLWNVQLHVYPVTLLRILFIDFLLNYRVVDLRIFVITFGSRAKKQQETSPPTYTFGASLPA